MTDHLPHLDLAAFIALCDRYSIPADDALDAYALDDFDLLPAEIIAHLDRTQHSDSDIDALSAILDDRDPDR